MLVTFRTDSHESITFFGEVALRLLKMMGHSGTVPGAILARDIPEALLCLTQALADEKQQVSKPHKEDDGASSVSMMHRALPLIALLEVAIENDDDVLWS